MRSEIFRAQEKQTFARHASVNSKRQNPPSPGQPYGVLHLLSARVPGFVPSELPGVARGLLGGRTYYL